MKLIQLVTLLGLVFFAQICTAQSAEKVYEITITTTDKEGNEKVKEILIEGEDLSQEEIDAMIKQHLDGTEEEVDVNINVNVDQQGTSDQQAKTITKIIKKRTGLHDEEKIIIDETEMEIEVINDKVFINGEEVKEGDFGNKQVRILKFEKGDDFDLDQILEEEDIEIGKDEKVYFIETEQSATGVAFLGVKVGHSKDGGVSIRGAVEGTSAERMGLEEGDIMMSIDGNKVIGFPSLSKIIKSYIPGEQVKLIYTRDGETMEADVVLDDYEAFNDNTVQRRYHRNHGKKRMGGKHHQKQDPNRATLGVMVDDQLVITKIIDESAAQQAGLQVGDKIVKINKAKMLSQDQFISTIKAHEIGDEIKLKVEREEKNKNVRAVLQKEKTSGKKYKHNKSRRTERIIIKEGSAARERSGAIKIRDFALSPNPSDGKFSASFEMNELSEGESITVRIIALDGKVMEESEVNTLDGPFIQQYDLTNAPEGIYLFQVEKNSQIFTKRFVIGRE